MRALAYGGERISYANKVLEVPEFSDLAVWSNSWDMLDAAVVDGRVVGIDDKGSEHMPMKSLDSDFFLLGADPDVHPRLPGPLYIPSSVCFNGRPAMRSDYSGIGVAQGASFPLWAGLSPNTSSFGGDTLGLDGTDTDVYFDTPDGYAQPYWVAVLGRPASADDPNGDLEVDGGGIWDATHGGTGTGPTIGAKIFGIGGTNWAVSLFGPAPIQITVAHAMQREETVLVFVKVNGASSFIEVNWRDANGRLQTLRQTGTLHAHRFREMFLGWVHGLYFTAGGIAQGSPSESTLDSIRNWAANYIPPAAVVAEEPFALTETFNKADGALGPVLAPWVNETGIFNHPFQFDVKSSQGHLFCDGLGVFEVIASPAQNIDSFDAEIVHTLNTVTRGLGTATPLYVMDVGGITRFVARDGNTNYRGYACGVGRSNVFSTPTTHLWHLMVFRIDGVGDVELLDFASLPLANVTLPGTFTFRSIGSIHTATFVHGGSGGTMSIDAIDSTYTDGDARMGGSIELNDNSDTGELFFENFSIRAI